MACILSFLRRQESIFALVIDCRIRGNDSLYRKPHNMVIKISKYDFALRYNIVIFDFKKKNVRI